MTGIIRRLALVALVAGITAMLLGAGPNPQTTEELLGKVSGRAFVGAVAPDPDSGLDAGAIVRAASTGAAQSITVITPRGEITVRIDQDTQISSPGGAERLLERISRGLPVRVAVLADRPPLGDDGTPTGEPASALKLAIIPAKATREHRRVIVTEKRDADNVTAVDSDGVATNIIGGLADDGTAQGQAAANIITDLAHELPEQGESAVLLVRPDLGEGKGERITAVFQTRRVLERLSRLAEEAKETEGDSFKSARLENLLIRHIKARGQALEKVRDKAESRFKQIIQRAEERTAAAGTSREDARAALSGLNADTADCVNRILGRVPASKTDIPPGQLQRVEGQCFRTDREGPQLRLVSPRPGTTLTEDQEVEIRFAAAGPSRENVEVLINGRFHAFEPETSRDEGLRVRIRVPVGEPVLSVEVRDRASDTGRESLLKVLYDVREDPPPSLRIVSPTTTRELAPGSTIKLSAQAKDNGEVVSVQFIVNGQVLDQAPRTSGITALDYVVPADASSLLIQAIATDNLGKTSTISLLLRVAGDPAPTVEFSSPDARARISATAPLVMDVRTNDNGEVISVEGVLIAGHEQFRLVFSPLSGALPRMNWRAVASVPAGATSVAAEVTATDNLGNTTTTTRTWDIDVEAGSPPTLKFLSPTDGSAVEEGSTIQVSVLATDDGSVILAEFAWPIVGPRVRASLIDGAWVATMVVPTSSTAASSVFSDSLPSVFAGAVTIDGAPAPDGTTVTAWVTGGTPSEIALEALAIDDHGNEATSSVALELLPPQIQVDKDTVNKGRYGLAVRELVGRPFAGETIFLRVNGVPISQTGTWQSGRPLVLDLSAVSASGN